MIEVSPRKVLVISRRAQYPKGVSNFILGTRENPLRRVFYAVYVLQNTDGSKFGVQLPIYMPHSTQEECDVITTTIEAEITTLVTLQGGKFPWSPRPITYSINFDNPVNFPYMILSWIDGKPMQWNDQIPISSHVRESVSRQLTQIMVRLALVTEKPDTGITAARYLLNFADKRALGVINEQMRVVNLKDCMQLRKLIREAHDIPNEVYSHPGKCPKYCTHRGKTFENCVKNLNQKCTATSFCLSHEEIKPDNIIVDDNYKIQGIINWSYAKSLPARLALRLPVMFSIESRSLEDTTEDDSSLYAKYLIPSPTLQKDRENYGYHITEALIAIAPGRDLAECAPMAADTVDVDWKHLIMLAAFIPRTHYWLAQRKFLIDGTFAKTTGKLLHKEKGWDHNMSLEGYYFAEDNLVKHGTGARKDYALVNFKRSKGGMALEWDYVNRWLTGHFKERRVPDDRKIEED